MKKIFTLLTFFIITLTVSAQFSTQNSSRLSIASMMNSNIIVSINNKTYQLNRGDADLFLNEMPSGVYYVRISAQRRGMYGRRSNSQVLYEGRTNLRRNVHVDIVINRFGKVFIDERQISNNYQNDDYWSNWNDQQQGMDQNSFAQLKQTLSGETYDNTRLTIAKQAISVNKFTSAQAKEIVMLFTYENNKLEIAKNIYANTTDKNNFLVVYDAFTYSSSKEELARYIQQYR